VIILASASLYLLGNGRTSLWDCDEPWFAQSSRQMLESGDWLVPRFVDQARYATPIFIYWAQAASMKLLGPTALASRLPSALAMIILLVILTVPS